MSNKALALPGEKQLFNGREYFAAGPTHHCSIGTQKCAFDYFDATECCEARCGHVIWLTYPDYVIHRLSH